MTAVASVLQSGDAILVRPLVGTLPEMKTLGATWDRRATAWSLPNARMHMAAVRDLLGHELEILAPQPSRAETQRHQGPAVIHTRLYDWQVAASQRLVDAPRGQLLIATPGLGKTAMAIVAADALVPGDQVLVVAPAPLLKTWARQVREWGTGDVSTIIVHGGEPAWPDVTASRWLITSWDVLALHQAWFMGDWPLVVLDESVMAKSRKSTRSLAIRGGTRKGRRRPDGSKTPDKRWANLRAGVGRVWLLSGSPTTRYVDDLWAQLAVIWPKAFRSYWRFAERYCVIEPNDWAPGPGVVVATRRDRDAVKDNSDLITVIAQEDVHDLPDYLPEAVDVDLTPRQATAYRGMLMDFVALLDSGDALEAESRIAQLVRLQQIVSYWDGESAKHDALVAILEGGGYEVPLLVWTHWREGAEALAPRLERVGLRVGHAHGGLSAKAKDREIEAYKAGELDALVLSLGVGKFGHTLTNTKTIAYVDKTWNADDYRQSLLRVKRIGLTWRPVLASLRAPGTVDDLVELNLEGKVEGISRVTNADLKEMLLGLGR